MQADSMLPQPGEVQAWDRYAYGYNSPLKYSDPTGHYVCWGEDCSYRMAPIHESAVLQVDLSYSPIKQFDHFAKGEKGIMACAIAAGIGAGSSWEDMAKAAIDNGYDPKYGMQPSQAAKAYAERYGANNVSSYKTYTLSEMYYALKAGKVVIVDMLVDANTYQPSLDNSVSHFARIIGIDWNRQVVYIENTLPGVNYWTLTFAQFVEVWYNPEKNAKIVPTGFNKDLYAEAVDYWAVVINPINQIHGYLSPL